MTATFVQAADTVSLLIKIESTPGGGVFVSHALINLNRSLSIVATATASKIARTDDPTQPMKTVRTVVDTDSTISGEGTLDISDQVFWVAWLKSGQPKNVQAIDSETGGMEVAGPYVLTKFEKTGSKLGEKLTASITLEQADDPVVTATTSVTAYP